MSELSFKNFVKLIILSFWAQSVFAQCPSTDIFFSSQADINNFTTSYPLCQTLTTGVSIIGQDITNLDSLSNIEEISSYLLIQNCPNLLSISGLRNINKIDELYLFGASRLVSLDGLNNIKEYKVLWIRELDLLSDLSDLSNSLVITRQLKIENNAALISLSGLEGLNLANDITINNNDRLANLNGLNCLNRISGRFNLIENDSLINLCGLDSLIEIEESFQISKNLSLLNFKGLNSLSIVNELLIHDNSSLVNLDGLSNLKSLESLEIQRNESLQNFLGLGNSLDFSEVLIQDNGVKNFTGFEGLTNISSLSIVDNDSLKTILGLNNLSKVNYFYILNNNLLQDLTSLEDLDVVIEEFEIKNNDFLKSLSGLSNLVSVGNGLDGSFPNFQIVGNNNLSNLVGLDNLNFVDGEFRIQGGSLQNLSGLNSFTFARSFIISGNPLLKNLNGLSNFGNAEDLLIISNNPILESISALSGLSTSSIPSDGYFFTNNSELSQCSLSNLCTLLNAHPSKITINGNLSGCSNNEEVVGLCNRECLETYYADNDEDGFGDILSPITIDCNSTLPSNISTNNLDCNDSDPNDNIIEIINNLSISGSYYANQIINSAGNIQPYQTSVYFQAGNSISLNPGFTSEFGSTFFIEIKHCNSE